MTNSTEPKALVGAEALKATFRRHASGVAIITSLTDAGDPIGFTATSVTSLGSNPPLVSFNIAQGSSSYPHLVPGKKVAIHTLGIANLGLAQQLAGPKENRFSGGHQTSDHGIPYFAEASAVLFGQIRARFEVEQNAVIVLDVIDAIENGECSPLLYFKRGYLTTGERLADNF